MDQPSSIKINWLNNPELQSALAGKKAGDKVRLEVEIVVKGVMPDGIDGTFSKIAVEGYEPKSKTPEGDIDMTADSAPAAIQMGDSGHYNM